MSQWVISVISGARADIRFYPASDRNSDMLDGRYVPLTTEVQCSKKEALFDHLVGTQ